jgi:hypothetical protein
LGLWHSAKKINPVVIIDSIVTPSELAPAFVAVVLRRPLNQRAPVQALEDQSWITDRSSSGTSPWAVAAVVALLLVLASHKSSFQMFRPSFYLK